MEIWKKIEGYENYSVSTYGRVRNKRGKELSPININGYNYVSLVNGNIYKKCRIHRLVAQAFIPNPNNYPVVNHKDEDKSNNHIDNLEWCTIEYNTNYGSCPSKIASKHKKSVIVDNMEFESIGAAANFINCPYTTLSGRLRRGCLTCYGHSISYT
jgi:hypothetical protein